MSNSLLVRLLQRNAPEVAASWWRADYRSPDAVEDLLREAVRHGVLGRIWKQRGEQLRTVFPPFMTERWRRAMRRLAVRNLASCDELIRAVQALQDAGVPVIPLKGPSLAVALTGSPCTRDYADIDLLVDHADSTRSLAILRASGYRIVMQASSSAAVNDQVALARPEGAMVIELQWDLGRRWHLRTRAGTPPLVFQDLWRRRTSVHLSGATLPSLGGEDQFLLLAVHGARHYWSKLQWVCDAADALAAQPGVDWASVFHRAGRLRCVRRVCLALQLSSDVLGVPVPEFALSRIRLDARVPAIARDIVRQWNEPEPPEWRADLDDLEFTLRSLDGWRDRARVGCRVMGAWLRPNARDRECLALPAWAAPVYYAIRPFRLAWRYGPEALRTSFGFASRPEEISRETGTRG